MVNNKYYCSSNVLYYIILYYNIMSHKILGEGTYGCVIKPSLKCKDKKTSKIYENKVSKVMRDWDAEKELKEMEFISNIKGIEKYAVNLPIMCKPDMKDPAFDEYVSKCDTYNVAESYENNPKELSLLLLDDGGLDMEQSLQLMRNVTDNDRKIFFNSFINLFEGLEFFRKNKIVHFDIKLINLVYNFEKGEAKFIDFGLMKKDETIKKEYTNNTAWYARNHFNWPPENMCGTKMMYNKNKGCWKYKAGYQDYNRFLNKLIDTFDVYSLCLALMDIFVPLYVHDEKNFIFHAYVIDLLEQYNEKSLVMRNNDLKALTNEYINLLKKYDLYIDKTKPIEMSPQIKNVIKKIKHNKDNIDNILKENCPKDKPIFNPKTKRFLKLCKTGYERNEDYKCIKTKKLNYTNTSINNKSINNLNNSKNNMNKLKMLKKNINNSTFKKQLQCYKENKDYNPKTKRCNTTCKKGYIRDKNFRCVHIKDLKLKHKSLSLSRRKSKLKYKTRVYKSI